MEVLRAVLTVVGLPECGATPAELVVIAQQLGLVAQVVAAGQVCIQISMPMHTFPLENHLASAPHILPAAEDRNWYPLTDTA